MNCPSCGKTIKENAAFCVFCGSKVSAGSFAIPAQTPVNQVVSSQSAQQTKPMIDSQGGRKLLNNRYAIEKEIGRGGMGRVYLALDTKMDGRLVIKEMLPQAADTVNRAYLEKRFIEEAKLLFNLKHPGLPGVLDYFVEGSSLFLVMEFINGKNLDDIQKDFRHGQVDLEKGLNWMKQIIDILIFLHNQVPPVVHRDIKPANILLTPEGKIYLVDFGVARTIGIQSVTQTAVGTYGYASPEHYSGKIALSSDIYSLGATFHHLFSGVSPQENDPFKFTPLSRYRTDIPEELDRIIIKMTKQERSERYSRIEEVLNDLNAIGSGTPAPLSASAPVMPVAPPVQIRQAEPVGPVIPPASVQSSKSTQIAFEAPPLKVKEYAEDKGAAKKKNQEEEKNEGKKPVKTILAVAIVLFLIFGVWTIAGLSRKDHRLQVKDESTAKVVAVKKKDKLITSPTPSPLISATPSASPSPSPSKTEASPTPEENILAEFPEETHPQANEGYFIECGSFDAPNKALEIAKRLRAFQFKPTLGKENGLIVVYAANSQNPIDIAKDFDNLKANAFKPIIITYKSGSRQELDRNDAEFQQPQAQSPTPEPSATQQPSSVNDGSQSDK
ncbi:MAG: serine/threonine protein kinase [Firmicutes bacterium]|nr:serine/threonine protein kinase [Bacillota bacterium]